MRAWNAKPKKEKKQKNNRSNIVIAIIFLLFGLILFKLFRLQIVKYGFYASLASGQHEVLRDLEPKRGRIFIQDKEGNTNNGLFPLATNKDFYLVYAKPIEISANMAEALAEKLYLIFDEKKVTEEVEAIINNILEEQKKKEEEKKKKEQEEKDEPAAEVAKINIQEEKITEEYLTIKRELETKTRKEKIIKDYKKILAKGNDPYEPLKKKVDEEKLKELYLTLAEKENAKIDPKSMAVSGETMVDKSGIKDKDIVVPGFGFTRETYRYYPENNNGAHILGFVKANNDKKEGVYGLEGFFNEELTGKWGYLRTERDAKGAPIIVNNREYSQSTDGSDLILTIDRTIQFTACKKLNAAVRRHGADGGSVIIMEPKTGAILAMCSYPDFDPNNYEEVKSVKVFNNPAIFDQYEPGSIFKVLTMAAGLDREKVTPDSTYVDTGVENIAGYKIENSDHKANGKCTMTEVLEKSLNTGVIHVMRAVTPKVFAEYVKNFGFGEKTGIELEAESKGDIKNLMNEKKNAELYAATASFGQGISVTPLQMINAYSAIANRGIIMKPYIVKEIVNNDGTRTKTEPREIKRVVSERAAALLGGMMVNVVEHGHGKQAGVKGYYVGGKTGTAQVPRKDGRGYEANAHNGSFAGFAPVSDPAFVMLVKIDRPRDVEWAESSAAPLFGEIAEFLLHYFEVPAEREIEKKK